MPGYCRLGLSIRVSASSFFFLPHNTGNMSLRRVKPQLEDYDDGDDGNLASDGESEQGDSMDEDGSGSGSSGEEEEEDEEEDEEV